ncbi:MAG: hypothetical protein SFY80_02920 [Verrucomicrobiota bacterium]|nr:hypothetical protein [Verrucomicrobiota bacterium]
MNSNLERELHPATGSSVLSSPIWERGDPGRSEPWTFPKPHRLSTYASNSKSYSYTTNQLPKDAWCACSNFHAHALFA